MKFEPNFYIEKTDEDQTEYVDVRITSGQFDGALLRFYNIELAPNNQSVSYNLQVMENARKYPGMTEWVIKPDVLEENSPPYDLAVASQNIMDKILQLAMQRYQQSQSI